MSREQSPGAASDLEKSAVGLMPHRTAEKPQAPSYVTVSLGFLTRGNPLRAACIFLLESGWLDGFTLLVILVNCLFLALMEPTKGAKQGRNRLIAHSELPFTIIFTTEMLIKIIALGFFIGDRAAPGTEGPGIIPPSAPPEQRCTYLRDAWNILDFLVTVSSLLALLPQINDNVMVLRTIRVLRPLRTISALPGMQLLIKTLLAAIPMLGNVLVMCAFFFIVFGILGVQLFKGVLRYRCFVLDAKNNPLLFGEGTPPSYADQMCYRKHLAWAGYSCQPGEACLEYANPFQGVVSFDNFMWSALTLFQIIVNQGWSPIMYSTMDATTAWAFFYFVAVIFLGSWFLISLLLGVVVTAYDDAVNEKEAEAEAQPHPAQKPSGSKTTSGGASGSTTPHTEIKAFRRSGSQRNLMAYSTSMSSMPALVLKVKAPVQEEEEPYDDSSGLKGMCKGIISHPAFQPGIIVLILANTVVLAMAHNGMSDRFNRGLDTTNLVLSVCFAGEMVLKLLGLGLKQYFADRFNIFDMIIVVLSLVEIFMSSGGALGSLRTLRVLRVLRLIKNWTSLHRFVITIWHTLASLSSLIIILLICVFVYAVVGMQLFGGKLGPPGQVPRHNYDSFVWAAITSFQVITVDDWNSVLYDAIRATDPALGGAFFITLIIVGRWLILNLIIAILLSGLDKDHDYELAEQQGTSTLTQLREVVSRVVSLNAGSMQRRGSLKSLKSRDWDKSLARSQADLQTRQRALDAWDTVRYEFRQGRLKRPILARKGAAGVRLESLEGRSFCILPTTSRLRKAAFTLIDDRRFDMCVLVFIGLSSICLATETAHDGPDKLKWLLRLDYVWIIVFGVEMLLKMIALGVVHNRHSYFRSAWHWLDAMVVAMSLVTALLAQSNLRWVRAFRALRVLRPLRVIKAVPELQLVVNALLSSLPKLGNVVVVSLVFMVVYAILGMELFMGKMSSCSNSQCCTNAADEATCHDVRVKADCTGYLLDDDTSPCLWQNSQFNFDNFAQAMVTLFVAATGQGWTALMYSGIDAVGVDAQPQPNHRLVLALYFISYIVLGSFFCLNLFVGVTLDNFSQQAKSSSSTGGIFMTKEQQAWVETQKKALSQHPKKAPEYPDHRMRRALCKLVESTYFEVGVLMAIMVNILFMALEHYKMSTTFTRMLSTADLAFTIMFALEAAIKIVAYYPAQYLSSGWNRFDAMVVVGNAIGIITKQGVGANVLRIFRVARIFRLLRQLRGLRMLFTTLVLSIPTMLNVAGLSLILFFVYAILGISLFGKVVRTDVLNTYLNFENFGTAMVLLFQMANGEAWNDVMIDYQVAPPTCDNHTTPYCKSAAGVELQQLLNQGACLADSSTNVWVTEVDNCGLSTISPIYFCSFQILGTFIMMNLVIAVVMENFSMSRDAGSKEVTQDDIEDFSLVWTQFDPAARGFIKLDSLPALLQAVEPPLGLLGVVVSRHHLLRFQKELNLKVGPDHRVYYHELLTAMSQKAMGLTLEQLPADVRCALQQRTKEGRKKAESRAPTGDAGANGVMFVDEDGREVEADAAYIYSTKLIQAAMRGYLHRKRLRQAREEQEQEGAYARAQAVASHVIELLDSAVLEHQPMSSTPYAEGAETIHANYFQDGTRRVSSAYASPSGRDLPSYSSLASQSPAYSPARHAAGYANGMRPSPPEQQRFSSPSAQRQQQPYSALLEQQRYHSPSPQRQQQPYSPSPSQQRSTLPRQLLQQQQQPPPPLRQWSGGPDSGLQHSPQRPRQSLRQQPEDPSVRSSSGQLLEGAPLLQSGSPGGGTPPLSSRANLEQGPPQFDQLGAQRLAVPDSRPAGSPARMLVRQNRSPLPFMEPNPLYDELNR